MPDAILIFTFAPVQSFIAQARRTSDLYVGSRILVELAQTAAEGIRQTAGEQALIHPHPGSLADGADDIPNRLVAEVEWDRLNDVVRVARAQFFARWGEICASARSELARYLAPDKPWDDLWTRQTGKLWEIYWAAARFDGRSFSQVYQEANDALAAAKRTRIFEPAEEAGLKDTLSGERAALHSGSTDGRSYWAGVSASGRVFSSRLQPDGRERLDALGAIKRFSRLSGQAVGEYHGFPSTSAVASRPFLSAARPYLAAYTPLVKKLGVFTVSDDPDWPYDGDLFYPEMLTAERLAGDYGLKDIAPADLRAAQAGLAKLYQAAGRRPSAYYAILDMDGDNMGERVITARSASEARGLSHGLAAFSKRIRELARDSELPHLFSVYNGGDDLLAMSALAPAVSSAVRIASEFERRCQGTLSAGIAMVHHQYPLSAGLRAARQALKQAKALPGKGALCLRLLKRSGEDMDVHTRWPDMGELFPDLVADFQAGDEPAGLAARFAYLALEEARTVTAIGDPEASLAMLNRLVRRRESAAGTPARPDLAKRLNDWAAALNGYAPVKTSPQGDVPQGLVELGKWLVAARFVAQGGAE